MNDNDYADTIELDLSTIGALVALPGVRIVVTNRRAGALIGVKCTLSARARHIVLAGGVLAQVTASGTRPAQAIVTL